jgi:hypothetical protein
MTEKAELDRVRHFHAELDNAASIAPRSEQSGYGVWKYRIVWGEQSFDYTAAEVRAWPEMKAKLVAHFSEMRGHNRAMWHGGASGWTMGNADECPPKSPLRGLENYARGLCLYREMLDDEYQLKARPEPPTGHPTPGSTGLRLNEEQREALKVDKYAEHRSSLAARIVAEGWGGGTENLEQVTARYTENSQPGARDRLVAALAAELRKPFEPRFPPESRSCRVYRSNDR